MSNKTYAQFNVLTISGRISHAELVDGKYGEFLAVTLLSELKDEADATAVQFNVTNGLLFNITKKGGDVTGRFLTVTGHLESFEVLFFDKKVGKFARLRRPRLTLGQATVLPGALGAPKKTEAIVLDDLGDLDIDEAPELPAKAEATKPVAVTPGGAEVDDF
tara:strand:+ start:3714 stop:4199 length:486 start_codon:yes stop_codon:yes gene_type:complete